MKIYQATWPWDLDVIRKVGTKYILISYYFLTGDAHSKWELPELLKKFDPVDNSQQITKQQRKLSR